MDLHAALSEPINLVPGMRRLIPTGISLEIPLGYEAQVRPRSGLALRSGITVVNSPGTIDADFRGEIGIVLINHGQEDVTIQPQDRIAQLVFAKVERAHFLQVETLRSSSRGEGGYGSTGAR